VSCSVASAVPIFNHHIGLSPLRTALHGCFEEILSCQTRSARYVIHEYKNKFYDEHLVSWSPSFERTAWRRRVVTLNEPREHGVGSALQCVRIYVLSTSVPPLRWHRWHRCLTYRYIAGTLHIIHVPPSSVIVSGLVSVSRLKKKKKKKKKTSMRSQIDQGAVLAALGRKWAYVHFPRPLPTSRASGILCLESKEDIRNGTVQYQDRPNRDYPCPFMFLCSTGISILR
jgi:hypothetical protein